MRSEAKMEDFDGLHFGNKLLPELPSRTQATGFDDISYISCVLLAHGMID